MAVRKDFEEDFVAAIVQLLLPLALHVRIAGVAKDAADRRVGKIVRDHLAGESDSFHHQRQLLCRNGGLIAREKMSHQGL